MALGKCSLLLAGLAMSALGGLATGPARAEVLLQGSARTLCLDVTSGTAKLASCNGGAGQNIFHGSGPQRYGTLCLQGTGGHGEALALKPCNNGQDQQWQLLSNGNYKNNGGWCAAANSSNTVIAAQCYSGPGYTWSTGTVMPASAAGVAASKLAGLPPGAVVNAAGQVVTRSGGGIVAQGAGNIVAQGAGNIVAQGAGNVILTSGGYIVAQGAGN